MRRSLCVVSSAAVLGLTAAAFGAVPAAERARVNQPWANGLAKALDKVLDKILDKVLANSAH